MAFTHQHSRRRRTGFLSLSVLAASASAIVIPTPFSSGAQQHASSIRKTLNFGPRVPTAVHSTDTPSLALVSFNAEASSLVGGPISSRCSRAIDAASCVGRELASSFVESLHPSAQFQLVDGYLSSHNGLFHAHFVQVIEGRRVANGNLNVNVDLSSSEILSYGDSSYASVVKSEESIDGWKNKVASWAGGVADEAAQVVFGSGPSRLDTGPQGAEDLLDEYSSPPFNPTATKHQVDPRHGLLSFLALQSPSSILIEALLFTARTDMIDLMTVAPSGESSSAHTHTIDNVPTAVEPVKASLVYIQDGEDLKLAWKYELRTDDNQYEAYVSATADVEGNEETLMVVDWVRDFRPTGGELGFDALHVATGSAPQWDPSTIARALGHKNLAEKEIVEPTLVEPGFKGAKPSYRVFPWGVNAPDEGKRETLKGSLIELDNEASPSGWHTIPSSFKGGKDKLFSDTRGNNVYAQDNPDGGNGYEHNYRPSGGANMTFDFKLGWPKAGTPLDPKTYIDAAVAELFYTNNEIHDLFYRYGFDEASGNFQDYNFGRGGLGNDAVQANAQDGSGTNNANFATPPDGQRPRMRMYFWTGAQPYRDGDFEAGIVIHEYAHGISTRLTGGPANSGCLGWGEAGGMGEGWGDFFATMIRMHSKNETEFDMGSWASARAGGIRNYPYSTSLKVNLDSYKSLDKPGYWGVHAIGEVWAEMLFEMAELLIAEHGFHSGLFPPAASTTDSDFYVVNAKGLKVPKYGNTLAVQLVVDGLKLQPCRPSFQDARDAILQADKALTDGANACLIWKAFSKRGLGPEAAVVGSTPWGGGVRTEDNSVPKKCSTK